MLGEKYTMTWFKYFVRALFLVCCFTISGYAQSGADVDTTPPSYCCGPSYTYCEAKNQQPTQTAVFYGYYRNRGLVVSECNTPGNQFFGNTIVVSPGFGPIRRFWYDWGADPNAANKISVWWSAYPWGEPLTIVYDVNTLKAVSVTSPSFP
jgi:hypothetical protein